VLLAMKIDIGETNNGLSRKFPGGKNRVAQIVTIFNPFNYLSGVTKCPMRMT
jgi:hypothetical protein